ncbi:TA2R9 protein, partial [Mionectes macconnelli]|nr:TA2R9 protein [Mionectes macconnelli]
SPEQFNVTSYDATAMAIMTFEALAGMWINAFIVSVIGMSWVKRKTLNSNEKILLLLGSSRCWFLCISWLYFFLFIIYHNYLYVHPVFQVLTVAQSFSYCSELSVSACLCVFYCIKIANFRNGFFIYLKVKIDKMVPWLLLGSMFFSLVIGILLSEIIDKPQCNNSTGRENLWKVKIKIDEHFSPIYFIIGLGYATSFMAVILSVLLLLFSLWRHRCNMQTTSLKDLSMDAHIKAMKSIISFFIMYNINIISLIVTMVYSAEGKSAMMFLIYVFQYAFPGGHSLILIFSNASLKNTLLRILPCVKCKVCRRQ